MVTMSVQLSVQQRAFLDAAAMPGAAVMGVGGPGTGKTTALIEAVVARVEGGVGLDRLVVLTWSRPEAQRLRHAVISRLGRSQLAPVITTVPGWCLALQSRYGLRDAFGELPRLLTGPEQDLQVRELLDAAGRRPWPQSLRAAVGTAAFAQQIRTGLARARQHGMDPDDVELAARQTGRPEWLGVAQFFEQYLDVLDAEHAWDYAELVHRTRLLVLDEPVASALARDVSGLFCDEFAECDPAQIGLLAQVHRLGIPVAVMADPQTSVFGFRGADPRAAADFESRFAAAGLPVPVRVGFSSQLRSAPGIVIGVRRLLARLPLAGSTLPMPPEALSPDDEPVRVRWHQHDSATDQAEAVASELREARLRGFDWSEQAVICRSGKGRLAALGASLSNMDVPVEVAGDEIALAEQACVAVLIEALGVCLALADHQSPDPEVLVSLLASPLCGLDPAALRRLGQRLWVAQPGVSVATGEQLVVRALSEAIEAAAPSHSRHATSPSAVAQAVEVPPHPATVTTQQRPSGPAPDVQDVELGAVQQLGLLLGATARDIERGRAGYDVLWQLWHSTGWPDRLRTDALSSGTAATAAGKDLDAICALFDLASRHVELTGQRGARTLIALVEGQEIPGDVARESDPHGRGVRVLTAHRARGQEWRKVVIVDATEGSWPGPRRSEGLIGASMIGDDLDGPTGMGPSSTAASWVQQERRLFALAASRACEELSIHAVCGTGEEQQQVSRFVTEMSAELSPVSVSGAGPRTLDSLVGELRRVTVDVQASSSLREAAVAQLAVLAAQRDDRGQPLVPAADPDQWWGIASRGVQPSGAPVLARSSKACDGSGGAPISLPVTGLERISRCPRAWFLDARAAGAAPAGPAAGIGSLVHLLAEKQVSEGLSPEAMHDCVDDFWPQLRFDAAWVADQQKKACHDMVDRLIAWSLGESHRQVLGAEIRIRYQLNLGEDAVELIGTIDRLERESGSGRLHIVDFKTGNRAPTAHDAALNVQLACYQLAVAGGACEQLTGSSPEVAGAELVYLRVPASAKQPNMPKVIPQPNLEAHPHLPDGPSGSSAGGPTWLHDLAREAVGYIRTGQYPALRNRGCSYCPHRSDCPAWAGLGDQS